MKVRLHGTIASRTRYGEPLCPSCRTLRLLYVPLRAGIAEGFESRTQALFIDFLGRAKGSAGEVRCQLYIALDRSYIAQAQFDAGYELCDKVSRQLSRFMGYLANKSNTYHLREDCEEYR